MSPLRTEYEFVLPRGYLDASGEVQRRGIMRLATARDELEPLRDPTITSADDPRLTILVLARVVRRLGSLELVTAHEIEGLFAADLAYLQDFYGVINFGTPADIDALLEAQAEMERSPALGVAPGGAKQVPAPGAAPGDAEQVPARDREPVGPNWSESGLRGESGTALRAFAHTGRRAAIEEVPTAAR
jgi:hypothetical protein